MTTITLPYGKQTRRVVLPDGWLGALIAPEPVTAAVDASALICVSLARPIGAPPLSALAQPGQRVALLVDDATRKTPAAAILPHLLADLHAAGIGRGDISIVLALGTHRPMSDVEIAAKLGPQIAHDYTIVNTPCTERDAFVELGLSAQGIPVRVNRAVVEADLRIGLGMITPHLDTGFSGGSKIVLPGVCAAATVDAFHRASAFSSENHLGNTAAPMRRTLEEFGFSCF
jgi:nickel-dependent lactate racemase